MKAFELNNVRQMEIKTTVKLLPDRKMNNKFAAENKPSTRKHV